MALRSEIYLSFIEDGEHKPLRAFDVFQHIKLCVGGPCIKHLNAVIRGLVFWLNHHPGIYARSYWSNSLVKLNFSTDGYTQLFTHSIEFISKVNE